ncbi:MAG: 30S ribosomal protein S1 [Nitrospirae bacterium]|nr:30S ribosomal protein S1 [Nitrospirota bacterium]MCL5237300.1 30S ribosomal protein S1 [Nitrospirota bacterium]
METQTKEETNALEKLYAETLQKVERGVIAKGRVIAVKNDGIVVDVGYKSEGMIPVSEFTAEELSGLKEGDDIEVLVERVNDEEGVVYLSKDKALRIRASEALAAAYNNNSIVEGKVADKTKGGLLVNVMGVKAFLPASQIDIKAIRDLDSYIGQTLPLKILKMTPQKGGPNQAPGMSLIVSRRAIIEEERNKKKKETLSVLKEGAVLKGLVKNITDYGVFVDLGGIDGLLHISDISWRRVNHPSEFFSIGDEAEFIVLKYDPETEKVTLGYKQRIPDPWLTVEEKYKPGMTLEGKVVTIADYGVFVEIEEGLEGLVHISELDWTPRLKHPSKYVNAGDEIEAVVLSINKDERRLSLSVKQLRPKPWELIGRHYRVGDKVTGRIKTITDFGAFLRLPEGVDGLVHISDLSWTKHIKHPSEVLKKGQKVDAVVLSLDPGKERMALGVKQLTPDPWQAEIPAKFKLGEEFSGKVLRITDFGIFVELEGGVEGLVYSSEVDASREIKEGDGIRVRIIKLNIEDRKIGLSMKNLKTHEN